MREQTDFIRELARAQYEPLAKIFDQYLGTDFFRKLSPVFEGAYAGFFTAGPVGGILGAVKDLPGLPKKLQETLGGAFEGAQTGTIVAGVSKMLGLKTSTTGAQVGGAIGAAILSDRSSAVWSAGSLRKRRRAIRSLPAPKKAGSTSAATRPACART